MVLVSVIIPVYNGGRFLKQALESVLNQTYQKLEVIVIDDGSTDNTKDIVDSFSTISYIYQENKGVASARNKAISIANGEYVTFVDADDIIVENKVELQLLCLENNAEVDICICNLENFVDPNFQHLIKEHEHFLNNEKISYMNMMVRRNLFAKVGLFNERYKHSSDFEWITRAKDLNFKVEILPDVLQKRRLHNSNISVVARKDNDILRFKILKESLERRRGN